MTRINSSQLRDGPSSLAICRARNGEVVVPYLEVACTFLTRLIGLQFRPALPPGHGLLLVPCSSIHTACVRFAINVVMLDRAGVVKRVVDNLPPWSGALAPRGTHAVLELAAGPPTVAVGEQLRLIIRQRPSHHLMRRLDFLSIDLSGDHIASKGEL